MVEAAATPHDRARTTSSRWRPFQSTRTSTLNVQPRIAGDLALLRGVAKAVLEASRTDPKAIDREFIERHTHGFEDYRALVEATSWAEIEHQSGVTRGEDPRARRGLLAIAIGPSSPGASA